MKREAGLTKQSLVAAVGAAYVGALVFFVLDLVWRFQTGADARICPVGSRDLLDWCTIGELSLAFLFDFLWALYGLPFALVLTAPCALGLGRLAPYLEERISGGSLASAEYGLGASLGAAAGALLGALLAGLAAACAGVWIFRRLRYRNGPRGRADAAQDQTS
jgi:hypothetical protein